MSYIWGALICFLTQNVPSVASPLPALCCFLGPFRAIWAHGAEVPLRALFKALWAHGAEVPF